jgi:hypothetical protein
VRSPAAQADGRAIRAILLDVWDPIGVAAIPETQDEYDAYIWPILTLPQHGASVADLTSHLVSIAVVETALPPNLSTAEATARALIRLPLASKQ